MTMISVYRRMARTLGWIYIQGKWTGGLRMDCWQVLWWRRKR